MPLTLDEGSTRDFLALWFRNCPAGRALEIRALHKRPPGRPMPQAWVFRSTSIEQDIAAALGRIARAFDNGDDVYVGALPRTRESGTNDAVGARCWIWGDVDYGTVGHKTPALYATREAALEGIKSCGIPPTALVDTGGGFHVWWRLAHELSPDVWEDAMRRAAQAVKADMNALDAPRILRVPGTLNFKSEPARAVRLIETSARLATLDDFLALPPYAKPEPPPYAPKASSAGAGASAPGRRPFDRANDEPVAEVLDWLGAKLHREGSRIYCACPVHRGSNASQMLVGGHSNVATCFGDCGGKSFTPVDLTAAVHKCTPKRAVDLMANRFGFDGFAKSTQETPKVSGASAAPASSAPASSPATAAAPTADWESLLLRSEEGKIRTTLGNIILVLENAPAYAGKLRWNAMALSPEFEGELFTDAKVVRLREAIEREYRMTPPDSMMRDALCTAAATRSYHPVQDYLNGLCWDGEKRIERLCTEVLNLEDSPLIHKMLRAWLISAVARAMTPGCKVDTALVLVGPQGFYKSSFFRVLGGPFFVDTALELGNKDAYMQLARAWIYELPEIDVITSQKHAGQIKGFVSSQADIFRPPFGRAVVEHPRSSVMVGTTNEPRFLSDATGSRRFWVIRVAQPIAIATLEAWRDQLFAEALAAYKAGESWWLTAADEEAREVANDAYCVIDPWEDTIVNFITARGSSDITISSIMGALNLETAQQTQHAMNRIGRVMHKLGYESRRKRDAASGGKRKLSVWQKVGTDTP